MMKIKKIFILPLAVGLLSTNVQLQAGELLKTNEALTATESYEPLLIDLADRSENPEALVKREDVIATLIYCLGEMPDEKSFGELEFLDKTSISYHFRGYFDKAYKLNIFSGTSTDEGLFAYPTEVISKEEAATMIGKALGLQSTEATGYVDEEDISPWALPYVAGLKKSALLWGTEDSFFPKDSLTWGEFTLTLQYAADSQKFIQPDILVLADNVLTTDASQKAEIDARPTVSMPMGISRDESGTVYIADSGNSMIAAMDNMGKLSTHSGIETPRNIYQESKGAYIDGKFFEAGFSRPTDVYMTGLGLLAADMGNNAIRILSVGEVYTYAGGKTAGFLDGYRLDALFNGPSAITMDESNNIYVSDTLNHCIRKIDSKGMVTTIAGTPGVAGLQDGDGLLAKLCEPRGLCFYQGALYIADSGNQRIRMYRDGELSTFLGGGEEKYTDTDIIMGDYADGSAEEARLNNPQGLSFANDGTLYIADTGNSMIRKYKNEQVTTLLGVGMPANALESKVKNLICEPVGILALEDRLIVTDKFTNRVLSIPLE